MTEVFYEIESGNHEAIVAAEHRTTKGRRRISEWIYTIKGLLDTPL
jgi:hypothetical protein